VFQVLVGFHPYVTTITAVAAIRAAFRNILFRGGSSRNHYRHHLQRPESMLHQQTSFYSP